MKSAKFDLMPETFGDLVRTTRLEKGWSQRELARRVKKSPTYIHYVEREFNPSSKNGRFQIGVEAVDVIADALGLNRNEARLLAGYAPKYADAKPQNPAEFVEALSRMGFEMQFSAELENLGPDDLQDLLDDIQAKLLFKTTRAGER